MQSVQVDKVPVFGFAASPDAAVGPNIRAQPVIAVTRAAGFASSGHTHTLLMSTVSQSVLHTS